MSSPDKLPTQNFPFASQNETNLEIHSDRETHSSLGTQRPLQSETPSSPPSHPSNFSQQTLINRNSKRLTQKPTPQFPMVDVSVEASSLLSGAARTSLPPQTFSPSSLQRVLQIQTDLSASEQSENNPEQTVQSSQQNLHPNETTRTQSVSFTTPLPTQPHDSPTQFKSQHPSQTYSHFNSQHPSQSYSFHQIQQQQNLLTRDEFNQFARVVLSALDFLTAGASIKLKFLPIWRIFLALFLFFLCVDIWNVIHGVTIIHPSSKNDLIDSVYPIIFEMYMSLWYAYNTIVGCYLIINGWVQDDKMYFDKSINIIKWTSKFCILGCIGTITEIPTQMYYFKTKIYTNEKNDQHFDSEEILWMFTMIMTILEVVVVNVYSFWFFKKFRIDLKTRKAAINL